MLFFIKKREKKIKIVEKNKFLTHKRLTKKNFNCIMIQIFKFGGSVYEKV